MNLIARFLTAANAGYHNGDSAHYRAVSKLTVVIVEYCDTDYAQIRRIVNDLCEYLAHRDSGAIPCVANLNPTMRAVVLCPDALKQVIADQFEVEKMFTVRSPLQ